MEHDDRHRLRLVLAAMPRLLVTEIVRRVTGAQSGLEVKELREVGDALLAAVAREGADVVVLGLAAPDVPDLCRRLLEVSPVRLVVGIANDARQVAFFAGDAGPTHLVATIRAALGQREGG